MPITQDSVVTLLCKITDTATGQVIEPGQRPITYLHGGYNNTLPGIEAVLDGQDVGFAASLTLLPEHAFGERDEALVRTIPKSEFPPGVKVGGQLQRQLDDGTPQVFNVVKIKGPQVLLDGNHPWAGKTLRFRVEVKGVRPASAEEIAHRHVHGESGHHH